eukprot:NODE_2965_length_721_cov_15.964286_g2092_i0.p1 GENE.NODE_2965_length_721_cov_15.964286_g2092_i0~~NODE_2965_length_721_cov_15.964286_g2092_i0.p1  ORF type:complete len:166 (-),score=2.03 NODE_2965_length_721_cov_15.964286_g2092_i0:94-591(-)
MCACLRLDTTRVGALPTKFVFVFFLCLRFQAHTPDRNIPVYVSSFCFFFFVLSGEHFLLFRSSVGVDPPPVTLRAHQPHARTLPHAGARTRWCPGCPVRSATGAWISFRLYVHIGVPVAPCAQPRERGSPFVCAYKVCCCPSDKPPPIFCCVFFCFSCFWMFPFS